MRAGTATPPLPVEPAADLVPLRTRLDAIAVVRVVAVAVTLGVLAARPGVDVLGAGTVALTLGYLAVTSAVEWARRLAGRRAIGAVRAVLVVDAVYLGLVVARTGGHESDLLFLVHLHVLAVTLLVSHGEGVRIAAVHAGLLVVGDMAADAGLLGGGLAADTGDPAATALAATTFLVVAAAAAACSRVNEAALRASRADLRGLVELGADLERVVHPDEVVDACCRHACVRLGFRRAAVTVHDGNGWWWGTVGDAAARATVRASGGVDAVVTRAWDGAAPVLVRHLDGPADPVLSDLLPGAVNLVVLPITVDGEHVGALAAEWGTARDGRIPAAAVTSLAQAATHTSLSLRGALLLRKVEELATRDTLTGLANRRLFEEALAREVGRAAREATPLSLIVMDLDHFKAVNDSRGHQVGDEVLRQVGAVLTRTSRAMDVPARYGGEEFVMLLPDCPADAAFAAADRLRAAVASEVDVVPVTLSAGVATMPDNATDADRLVAAADSALYDAKRAGRNRSVASTRHRRTDRPGGNPTVTPDVHHG